MAFLLDTLASWLAPTASIRNAGRARLVGRMLGGSPVPVTHPALAPGGPQVWHVAKGRGAFATTWTTGLRDLRGHELVAFTAADVRDPAADPISRVLVAASGLPIGGMAALPTDTLGRSAHHHVVVAGPPTPLDPRTLPDWEAVLGVKLAMVVTLTDRERAWVEQHGADALLARFAAQGIAPMCDRRAGDLDLER